MTPTTVRSAPLVTWAFNPSSRRTFHKVIHIMVRRFRFHDDNHRKNSRLVEVGENFLQSFEKPLILKGLPHGHTNHRTFNMPDDHALLKESVKHLPTVPFGIKINEIGLTGYR